MDNPQTATWLFLAPVAIAYLAACALWLIYDWRRKLSVSELPLELSDRPNWDLGIALAAGAGILLLGAVYRHGWLLPAGDSAVGRLGWIADNAIIYSPLAVVMCARRQSPRTVFLSTVRLPEKLALGVVLGVMAVLLYLGLRSEIHEAPDVFAAAIRPQKLVNFVPVFLEGVAVAFLFVRLRWATGMAAAVLIPSLLFAAAHVPGAIEEGRSVGYIAIFFVFNTLLPAAIFWVVARSRDVVWIGLVHYLMDVAIRAV